MCVVYVAVWGWYVGCLVWCVFCMSRGLETAWGWSEVGFVRCVCDVCVRSCAVPCGLSMKCALSYVSGVGDELRVGLGCCGV